ncbi:MAG: PQQ-dependent sugar dehydrogenase [Acidimicrobiales bacterium]
MNQPRGTRTLRLGVALVTALVATACGSDDPAPARPTTVPRVTSPPVTTATEPAPSTPNGTAPTTGPAEAPDGDVTTARVTLEPLVTLAEPIDTVTAPNGELWIAQRGGIVVVVDPVTGAVGDTVLDLSAQTVAGGERGLLGLAVDRTHLYADYTDTDGATHVDAFRLEGAGRPGDGRELLTIPQPFPNHNGGGLAIGPDGMLYIGVGDGGAAGDPLGGPGPDHAAGVDPAHRTDPRRRRSLPRSRATTPTPTARTGQPEIFLIGARSPWPVHLRSRHRRPLGGRRGPEPVGGSRSPPRGERWLVEAPTSAGTSGRASSPALRRRAMSTPSSSTPTGVPSRAGAASAEAGSTGRRHPGASGFLRVRRLLHGRRVGHQIVGDRVVFQSLEAEVHNLVGITADPADELLTLSLDGEVSRLVAR